MRKGGKWVEMFFFHIGIHTFVENNQFRWTRI